MGCITPWGFHGYGFGTFHINSLVSWNMKGEWDFIHVPNWAYFKSIFLSCIQYKFLKRHNLGFIFYRQFSCNASCAHSKATPLHKPVAPWWWPSDILCAFLCSQTFGFIDDHFFRYRKAIVPVMYDPLSCPLLTVAILQHAHKNTVSFCPFFCSWSSCFLHSPIMFLVGGGPKCLSVPMFFGVLHYLWFKRDFIWNPFLLWHLSTITVDRAGDYATVCFYNKTQ